MDEVNVKIGSLPEGTCSFCHGANGEHFVVGAPFCLDAVMAKARKEERTASVTFVLSLSSMDDFEGAPLTTREQRMLTAAANLLGAWEQHAAPGVPHAGGKP